MFRFRPWVLSEWGGEEVHDEKRGLLGPQFLFLCLFVFRGEVLQGGAPVCSPCFGEREHCGFSPQSSDGKPRLVSGSVGSVPGERVGSVNLSFVFESDAGFHNLMSDAGAGSSGTAPTPGPVSHTVGQGASSLPTLRP